MPFSQEPPSNKNRREGQMSLGQVVTHVDSSALEMDTPGGEKPRAPTEP